MGFSTGINVVFRTDGVDTNGGGYLPGSSGTNYSNQATAAYAFTNGQTLGTTTVLLPGASSDMVGNLAYITGGSGPVAANLWYQIISVTPGTSILVDRSTGLTSGTGVTVNIGGSLLSPGIISLMSVSPMGVANMKFSIKYNASSSFTYTTTTPGIGGPGNIGSGFSAYVEGFDITPGDRTGNKPTVSWGSTTVGSATYAFHGIGSGRQTFSNIIVNGNHVANACGFDVSIAGSSADQCVAMNCDGTAGVGFLVGSVGATGMAPFSCQANTCITGFLGSAQHGAVDSCDAVSCTTGYSTLQIHTKCLARTCTNGFSTSDTDATFTNCTADSNTTTGFVITGRAEFLNSLATNQSSGTGFSIGSNLATMRNCAGYNNSTNFTTSGPLVNQGFITPSTDPYVNQSGGDFRPNSTATGGALLRGAGIGVYGQTDTVDVGAVQSTPGSGASMLVNPGLAGGARG